MKRTPYFVRGGLGKRAIHLLVVACLLLGAGCAGNSALTDAYNTINAVSAVRNGLQPIYAEVVKLRPEVADEIEMFDAEFHKGIESAYETLILVRQGDGTIEDYRAKVAALVAILDRYKVEEKVPELSGGIELVKKLLGVVV